MDAYTVGYAFFIGCGVGSIIRSFFHCVHQWTPIDDVNVSKNGIKTGKIYVLCCDKCGKIQQEKITA